jgi:hypothetical protein
MLKKSAEEALEASRSSQTSADESEWSSDLIERINNLIYESMNL